MLAQDRLEIGLQGRKRFDRMVRDPNGISDEGRQIRDAIMLGPALDDDEGAAGDGKNLSSTQKVPPFDRHSVISRLSCV